MFNLSGEIWEPLGRGVRELLRQPALELQCFASVLAVIITLLLSFLIQRMLKRRLGRSAKYGWIATTALPALLPPTLLIFSLVVAGWISALITPVHPLIIVGFIKLAMVWLAARTLLLLTQRHILAYFISTGMLIMAILSVTHLLAPTEASLNDVAFETATLRLSLLGVIRGVFTLVILYWGASVLSKTGESWMRHMRLSFGARELSSKFLRLILYMTATVLTLNQMGVDLTALTVFGGALAVGLGFGLQKITSNFISGIILLFEKTIEAGDLIEVGGEKGWVRQMAIRHTMIETADGREMLIPNEDLIIGKVTNWTYTNTRARIDIALSVVYESDIDLVRKLLLASAESYPQCLNDPKPSCFLKEFGERGMQFLLVFWIPDIQTGPASAKSDVMMRIVTAFRAHGVVFAVVK